MAPSGRTIPRGRAHHATLLHGPLQGSPALIPVGSATADLSILRRSDGSNQRAVYDIEGVSARACWSPDGRRLAVLVVDLQRDPDGTIAAGIPGEGGHARIEVMDFDGEHRELFPLPEGFILGSPEWVDGD